MSNSSVKYRCRGDFILFRLVNKGEVRGLVMPDQAAQGKERVVVAIGPKVENLDVGDKVLVIGSVGVDTIQIPSEADLYMTREANVALIELPESTLPPAEMIWQDGTLLMDHSPERELYEYRGKRYWIDCKTKMVELEALDCQ